MMLFIITEKSLGSSLFIASCDIRCMIISAVKKKVGSLFSKDSFRTSEINFATIVFAACTSLLSNSIFSLFIFIT